MEFVNILISQLGDPFRIGLLVALLFTAQSSSGALNRWLPIGLGLVFVAVLIPDRARIRRRAGGSRDRRRLRLQRRRVGAPARRPGSLRAGPQTALTAATTLGDRNVVAVSGPSRGSHVSSRSACSPSAQAAAQSCTAEVGAEEAQTYVDQCLEVSAATHPPCNADNPCQMIWDEIDAQLRGARQRRAGLLLAIMESSE